jgi:hypothetical protein
MVYTISESALEYFRHWSGAALKGTGFSPYVQFSKSMRALAPEGMFIHPSIRF